MRWYSSPAHTEVRLLVTLHPRHAEAIEAIVDLALVDDPSIFVTQMLALLVSYSGARRGYVEIGSRGTASYWSTAAALDDADVARVRDEVSSGIVRDALERGEVVETASAWLDPRFAERESVRQHAISAVVCAPIGDLGVVYLEGRTEPGPFAPSEVTLISRITTKLAPVCRRVLRTAQAHDPTRPARDRLKNADRLLGRSAAVAVLLDTVALVAPLDIDVLITGPTGSGKSEVARLIVENSARTAGPFVHLNCAAIPEALFESEMFGAVPGAFTGARKTEGKVAAAQRGTLFLDEVGEMPLSSQAKLLQVLQERRYHAVGSTKAETADVRVIAATNVDLDAAVASGRFRQDLLYRLHVVPLRLPGLAERIDDIPHLAAAFVEASARRLRGGLRPLPISPGAMEALCAAEWPGNVRQLANVLQAALIRANGEAADRIGVRHVFPGQGDADVAVTWQDATRAFQREHLRRALDRNHGNLTRTAAELDLSRSHLYELVRAFGIRRADGDV